MYRYVNICRHYFVFYIGCIHYRVLFYILLKGTTTHDSIMLMVLTLLSYPFDESNYADKNRIQDSSSSDHNFHHLLPELHGKAPDRTKKKHFFCVTTNTSHFQFFFLIFRQSCSKYMRL